VGAQKPEGLGVSKVEEARTYSSLIEIYVYTDTRTSQGGHHRATTQQPTRSRR